MTSPNFRIFTTTAKALSRLSFQFSLLLGPKRVGWIRFVVKPFGKNTGHATGFQVNLQINDQSAPPHRTQSAWILQIYYAFTASLCSSQW